MNIEHTFYNSPIRLVGTLKNVHTPYEDKNKEI